MITKKIENVKNIVRNYNVLIVEDDSFIREQLSRILKKLFKEIYIAVDGKDGLSKYKENKNNIHIIITDLNMPHIGGLQMIEYIKEIDKDIPILILSAHSESHFFMKSIRLGVDGYLQKPLDSDLLMDLIKKVVLKKKLQDDLLESTNFLNQYKEAADESAVVSKTDIYGNITYINQKFCDISGYKKEYLIGKKHNILRHPKNSSSLYKEIWNTIKIEKRTWHGTIMNKDKYDNSFYMDTMIKPIFDTQKNVIEYISLQHDISDVISPRRLLNDFINNSVEPMVVMMEIEHFGDIEKYYGIEISEKIEKKFETDFFDLLPNHCEFDKIYSSGYGVYALAQDKTKSTYTTNEIIANIHILQNDILNTTLHIDMFEYDISVVISMAYGEDALLNARHGLMYLKNNNKRFTLANGLSKEESRKSQKNLEILTMIRKAINSLNIVSLFQPIINNKTKNVEKYESLVRLIDENGKVISPFYFLDTAKKGQYYSQITSIVLDNSFLTLNNTDADISINLSILDIEKKATREKIYSLLEKHNKHLHRLVFELLEDEAVKDFDLVKSFIHNVKTMGVKIAIDDFGVGYSNFERLLEYQPDILKIDGSLIKNIDNNSLSFNIVETIVAFAKKEKILTVAEYVENEDIFNILNDLGIDYSQGYYFGKPSAL